MRRFLILISALVMALVSLGASQKDSRVNPSAQAPAETVEASQPAPRVAPAPETFEATVALPEVPAPAVPSAAAQSPAAYQLNWYSINGGGATNASSASYQMGLSVGQSVAGTASSANFDVGIGFWYGAAAGGGCPIVLSGDINLSGQVTTADIIALVNYVLKSGLPPLPCIANGDINCNGQTTTADIIALVNYVLKSGAPPCNTCTSPLAAGC